MYNIYKNSSFKHIYVYMLYIYNHFLKNVLYLIRKKKIYIDTYFRQLNKTFHIATIFAKNLSKDVCYSYIKISHIYIYQVSL